MATFAKTTFSHASYAAHRPTYPPSLYTTILTYHRGPRALALDLGCGHGIVSHALSPSFTRVIGTDPSAGMIAQARSLLTTLPSLTNVSFESATAEDMPFVKDGSVDMVVAGQAAHWFDYSRLWRELKRVLRPGGTVAFWGYQDCVFIGYPRATALLDHYCYADDADLLGPYWSQPGRSIVQNKLRDVVPPAEEGWGDVARVEYEPDVQGVGKGAGPCFLRKRMTLGACREYVGTFSAVHAWRERHLEARRRVDGGEGDVVDALFDEMVRGEEEWRGKGEGVWDIEVEVEWGSGLVMARRGE